MLVLIILIKSRVIWMLKCYQCTTTVNRGCFSYNLDIKHLKECVNKSEQSPVCRLISQVQLFTPDNDISIIRECAYKHEPLENCELSKFNNIHYSLSCECNNDGCNEANRPQISYIILVIAVCSSIVK